MVTLMLVVFFIIFFEGCGKERKNVDNGNGVGILENGSIYDLGGHVIAYLMDAEVLEYEENWLVITDLEKMNSIYIPNSYSKILDIAIENFFIINLKYKDEKEGSVREANIPVYLSNRENDILEIYSSTEKVIVESPMSAESLPKTVWEETVINGEKIYQVEFERIGLVYDTGSIVYGGYADYRLIVKDEKGNVVSSQIFMGYPVSLEEVYWIKDISGDDFPDVILCAFYLEGDAVYNTKLYFMVWNSEKSVYESKSLPWNKSVNMPVWNEELSSVIFADVGDGVTMKMFSVEDGEWQLHGELVKNDIKIVLPEQNMPWSDANSIWCLHNTQNEWLFPGYGNWNTIEETLNGDKIIWKYVQTNR